MFPEISRAWIVFLISSSLFLLSQFYRAAIAVITPQLIADLSLNTRQLSLMSAAFFYAFAFMQFPIAVYLDRIGARKSMIALNLIAVMGAFVFAMAGSSETLIFARILLGIGMSCNLMGPFKLISVWFSPGIFATLSSILFSLGTAGSIFATTPLVLMVQWVGWRYAFVFVAGINLLLTAFLFFYVGDAPSISGATRPIDTKQGMKNALFGIRKLLGIGDYWIISLASFCRYGIYASIQALYAGLYLIEVMKFSALEAGNVILLMNVGYILAGPLFGLFSDKTFHTRKGVIIPGLFGTALILAILGKLPVNTSFFNVAVLFTLLGMFSSTSAIMYAHSKDLMPLEYTGAATTGTNFFTIIGSAFFLQILGIFLQQVYPENPLSVQAFGSIFLICAGSICLVALIYFLSSGKKENKNGRY